MEEIALTKIQIFEKIHDKEIELRESFMCLKSILNDQCQINVKRQKLIDFVSFFK